MRAVPALVVALLIVACGSTYSASEGPTGADGGLESGSSSPASSSSSTSSGGGGTQPPEGNDPACAARQLDDTNGLYVAPSGSDSNPCTRGAPCRTIQHAIDHGLTGTWNRVYVAPGTYDESLVLNGGFTISGGWNVDGAAWTTNCGAGNGALVTLAATTNVGLRATDGLTTLRLLTMKSKPSAAPGETLIGVIASGGGARIVLQDVALSVAAGGAGSPGAAASGYAGDAACDFIPSGGYAGPGGNVGTGGSAALSSPTFAAGDGAPGEPGVRGMNGTAAPPPQSLEYSTCTDVGGGTCGIVPMRVTSGPGTCGCGGRGGVGGSPGTGGGSSIGAVSDGGYIQFMRGSVTTGDGGSGGEGSLGALGEIGMPGVSGTAASYLQATGSCSGTTPCADVSSSLAGGAAGGAGGRGGQGGQGGGGGGGSSISYVKAGSVLEAGGTVFTLGLPGVGGAPNGAVGRASRQYP